MDDVIKDHLLINEENELSIFVTLSEWNQDALEKIITEHQTSCKERLDAIREDLTKDSESWKSSLVIIGKTVETNQVPIAPQNPLSQNQSSGEIPIRSNVNRISTVPSVARCDVNDNLVSCNNCGITFDANNAAEYEKGALTDKAVVVSFLMRRQPPYVTTEFDGFLVESAIKCQVNLPQLPKDQSVIYSLMPSIYDAFNRDRANPAVSQVVSKEELLIKAATLMEQH